MAGRGARRRGGVLYLHSVAIDQGKHILGCVPSGMNQWNQIKEAKTCKYSRSYSQAAYKSLR